MEKKAKSLSSKRDLGHVDSGTSRARLGFFFLLILLGAFFLRTWQLTLKPVHFDEGINGHFVATIWRNGFYKYDPTNFHGPLYFYILQLAELVFGWGIFGFRFVTGLIQIATLIVIGKHKRFVGRAATATALVLAVSPAFVFYSRYAIHESLFIFAQVAFSYGYFLYRYERNARSLWWMALALVILITTKETFFIFVGTWFIAVGVVNAIDRLFPKFGSNEKAPNLKAPEVSEWFGIGVVSVLVILALFTGFFVYTQGAVDMLTALQVWTKTGTAKTGHEKEFVYWLDLLKRYEWPTLAGLALSPIVFFTVNRSLRILILTGFGTWLAYSLIPYKTPWLIMNMIWPLAFSAGALLAKATPSVKKWPGLRTAVGLAVFISVCVSAKTMWRLNFHDYAKKGEPYVYVQSTQDFKTVVDLLYRQTAKFPQDRTMKIAAVNRDSWPLPYLLIPFTNVNWGRAEDATIKNADVILSDEVDRSWIESRLEGRFFVLPFQIRDSYQQGQAYLAAAKFGSVVPGSTPIFEGAPKAGENREASKKESP